MADYAGIRDAADSIATLLRAHVTTSGEPGLQGVPIRLDSPRELEGLNLASAVSCWVHRVDLAADLVNRPVPRTQPLLEPHRGVPVDLALLVTPINADASTRLLLLGRIFQVLGDHARLRGPDLIGSLAGTATSLSITPAQLGAYEMNLLWSSQQTHLRPGAAYRVSGLTIDTHREPQDSPRVLTAESHLSQVVGVEVAGVGAR